jgi:AraC-like DNA-binding protein
MSSLGAAPPGEAGATKVVTTALLPTPQQFDFYREAVLRRVLPTVQHPEAGFRGGMRVIVGRGAELIEHRSDPVDVERSAQRLRGDGCDDISIDLMRHCTTCTISQGGDRVLRSGELCFIDYGQPVSMVRSRHIANGIIVSRARAREVVGSDVSSLVGKPIPRTGFAAVLSRHLIATFDEAANMSAPERAAATDAAAEMMLVLLRARLGRKVDEDGFPAGFYRAARIVIERHCTDPDLTPDRIAAVVGCSRASLYRAFARHEETVAHAIWLARLERASQLLASCAEGKSSVSEIAWRCGFRQPASFTRMFRRHYGFSPSDARVLTLG